MVSGIILVSLSFTTNKSFPDNIFLLPDHQKRHLGANCSRGHCHLFFCRTSLRAVGVAAKTVQRNKILDRHTENYVNGKIRISIRCIQIVSKTQTHFVHRNRENYRKTRTATIKENVSKFESIINKCEKNKHYSVHTTIGSDNGNFI